jgi:glutamine synthetase
MHFHFSPLINEAFMGVIPDSGAMVDAARWLIVGLVEHGGMLMAFGNRADSSLLRLSQAKEAPNCVTWGRYDRKALVRLPIVARDEHGRQVATQTIEFRLPDGSTHPHLLLAGIAQAMRAATKSHDLEKVLERTASNHKIEKQHVSSVPKTMQEIAACLIEQRGILEAGDVFPTRMLDNLIETLQRP